MRLRSDGILRATPVPQQTGAAQESAGRSAQTLCPQAWLILEEAILEVVSCFCKESSPIPPDPAIQTPRVAGLDHSERKIQAFQRAFFG